jgi:hypothetical protein
METILPGIILVSVLVLLFILAANRYNKNQKIIEQHVKDGNITPEAAGITRVQPGSDIIDIVLRQRHFEDTNYSSNTQCAVAKALKEKFPNWIVMVGTHDVELNNGETKFDYDIYHEDTSTYQWERGYEELHFIADYNFATQSININSNSKIRNIQLRKR